MQYVKLMIVEDEPQVREEFRIAISQYQEMRLVYETDSEPQDLGNPYLEKGIRLVVDGADPELVRANVIAYLKACVLYVANGMKWEKSIADFRKKGMKYIFLSRPRRFGKSHFTSTQKHDCR